MMIHATLPASAHFVSQRHIYLFSILFLISGFSGLIYEVVWERMLQMFFGVNFFSVTLIVSAYMLGLGIGSLIGGRVSQFTRNPLLAYGLLEGGICLLGLISPSFLMWLGARTAGSPLIVVFLVSFLFLLLPTLLMGATLPVLAQAFIVKVGSSGRVIGLLYGINTLGAAFGALISGFVLIGWLGLDGAVYFSCALNAIVSIATIGLVIFLKGSANAVDTEVIHVEPVLQNDHSWGYKKIIFAAFLIGFIHLGYQMLWFRVLTVTNKSTVYNFPVLLFIFLFGLAIGGYLIGRMIDQHKNRLLLFAQIEMMTALMVVISFLTLYFLLSSPLFAGAFEKTFLQPQQPLSPFVQSGAEYIFSKRAALNSLLQFIAIPILLILPGSLLMGCGIPILDRIAIDDVQSAGRRIGDVYVSNILGSVSGTIVVPLILLNLLNTEGTLKVLVACSLAFPILYIFSRESAPLHLIVRNKAFVAFCIFVIASVLLLPNRQWIYEKILLAGRNSSAVFNESHDAILTLTKTVPSNLLINGDPHSFFPSTAHYEADAVLCAGAALPKSVFIIGLGGGHTVSTILHAPGVEEITVVELLTELRPFLEANFEFIGPVLSDPRVQYIVDDGRRYLYSHPEEKFDLIIIDPQWTSSSGSNNLYSVEALELYQAHLTGNGVLCAWTNEHSVMPVTFARVFPYLDKMGTELVAKGSEIHYDYDAMKKHREAFLSSPNKNIDENGANRLDPIEILANYDYAQSQIQRSGTEIPVLTDRSPYLEYYFFHKPAPQPNDLNLGTGFEEFLQRITNCDDTCKTVIAEKWRSWNPELH